MQLPCGERQVYFERLAVGIAWTFMRYAGRTLYDTARWEWKEKEKDRVCKKKDNRKTTAQAIYE